MWYSLGNLNINWCVVELKECLIMVVYCSMTMFYIALAKVIAFVSCTRNVHLRTYEEGRVCDIDRIISHMVSKIFCETIDERSSVN